MTIDEILNSTEITAAEKVAALQEKIISVPAWQGDKGLVMEYDPTKHPVMDKAKYPDEITKEGVKPVTRITLDLPRLACKRMTELCCGIPVKRVYKPYNERQREIAKYIEAIYDRNRIDSVNVKRLNMLFAGCEVMTLWYAVDQPNDIYGFKSRLKLRCRNFSPMNYDGLYPLFDEYGDMVAMSVAYTRKVGKRQVKYLDAYTATKHVKYSDESGEWVEVISEDISILKIPAVYAYRPTPIWENQAPNVFEAEWALSRNGNYLRKNSKPLFVVFANEVIDYGDEGDENEGKGVMQYPQGASAQYVTWQQATENLKYFIDEIRANFFRELQLPDWSYEKMSQQALSGESRKQLFVDAQMKVKDESGDLLEFFDREINVVKAFLKVMLGESYTKDIDALRIENKITPFSITDKKETVDTLMAANGGEPIMSQRESIEEFGHSDDVDRTMQQIADQRMGDTFEPTE